MMKNLINKISGTMLIIFLIGELFGVAPDVYAQTYRSNKMDIVKGYNLKDYGQRLNFVKYAQLPSGYSTCARCGIQWKYINGHSVMFNERGGMFALCEYCWDECNEQERIFYYTELWKAQLAEYKELLKNDRTGQELKTLIANIKKESEQGANSK